jgi:hypothetical protein
MTPTNLSTTGSQAQGDISLAWNDLEVRKNIALAFPINQYNTIKNAAKKDSRSMGAFLFVAAQEYIRNHNL